MATICNSRQQFAGELDWQLQTMQDPSRKYSFKKAFLDLTVFGTLYQIGSDFADLARCNRVLEWIRANEKYSVKGHDAYAAQKTAGLLQEEQSEKMTSLASKALYLGSLASLYFAPNNISGLAGCIGCGAFFMFKAGFAASEEYSAARIQSLRNQLV